ncbi:hypothetical protein OEZ86_009126 [Tetradesmus obliquus]|nr:hypothetical protein OEZ86_009126 [Tetradesmus obliquus]
MQQVEEAFRHVRGVWEAEASCLVPLITAAVHASSTDNEQQALDNTLHNDRHFWSSTGSPTQVADEGLLFELAGPAVRVAYVQLAVYRAFYQAGYPVYPPMQLQVWVGPSKHQLAPGSPLMHVQATDALQTFALYPDAPVARFMQLRMYGKLQKQQEDLRFYIALRYIAGLGDAADEQVDDVTDTSSVDDAAESNPSDDDEEDDAHGAYRGQRAAEHVPPPAAANMDRLLGAAEQAFMQAIDRLDDPGAVEHVLAAWLQDEPLVGPQPRAAQVQQAGRSAAAEQQQLQQQQQQQQDSSDQGWGPLLPRPVLQPVRVDVARAARFGVIGLTLHGPLFFKGFQWLDGKFGTAKTLQNAVTKSLVGQVTLFPTYTSLVLLYSSLLEGRSIQEAWQQVQYKLPQLFVTGSVYWPTVNVANFMFVPPQQRVLAVNACAILWNTYLSYVNAAPLAVASEAAAS